MSLHTYSFSPTPCKLPEEPAHTQTSLDVMHTRQVPNSCLLATGWVPERRGGGGEPHQKQEPILQFSTPSTAQLPGYCPRPGRHLLWVISICMVIITAFGKKIPLSKSPAELLMPAQNWRRQLRQTPARLLPITRGPPVPPPHTGPKRAWTPLPCSLQQHGPAPGTLRSDTEEGQHTRSGVVQGSQPLPGERRG